MKTLKYSHAKNRPANKQPKEEETPLVQEGTKDEDEEDETQRKKKKQKKKQKQRKMK